MRFPVARRDDLLRVVVEKPVREIPGPQGRFGQQCRTVITRRTQVRRRSRRAASRLGGGIEAESIPPVADQTEQRYPHPYDGSPQGITRFQQAGVLNHDHRQSAADPESGGDGDRLTLPADSDQNRRAVVGRQFVEQRSGIVIRQADQMGDTALPQGVEGTGRTKDGGLSRSAERGSQSFIRRWALPA